MLTGVTLLLPSLTLVWNIPFVIGLAELFHKAPPLYLPTPSASIRRQGGPRSRRGSCTVLILNEGEIESQQDCLIDTLPRVSVAD